MARILAIDFGTKRTGIACTDPNQIIASGLKNLPSLRKLRVKNNKIEFRSI